MKEKRRLTIRRSRAIGCARRPAQQNVRFRGAGSTGHEMTHVVLAHFGSAVMSDLSPGCAPKRTSADHSEFMGSNSNCLADSSPLLRRREVEDERDASGIAETMKVNPPRKRPKACAEGHTWARDISRVSQGDMAIKSWFAESLGLATMRILLSVTSLGRGRHRGA